MAQAVEVHIGAAHDGHHGLAPGARLLDILFQPSHAQGSRRFGDGAGVVEDVLDRRADLVSIHADHLVHTLPGQPEGLLADLFHCDAIGEDVHFVQQDASVRLQGLVQGCRTLRFHADDLRLGAQILHVGANTGNEAAPAHGDEDGVDAILLPKDFHPDGALSCDHFRIIIGVDEDELPLLGDHSCVGTGLVVGVPVKDRLRLVALHCIHLDLGGGGRHDDDRGNPEPQRRERHPLGMVARRSRDDAVLPFFEGEACDLVVGPPELEGKDGLEVLPFQKDPVPQAFFQQWSRIQGGFGRDLIDLGLQDLLDVLARHRAPIACAYQC